METHGFPDSGPVFEHTSATPILLALFGFFRCIPLLWPFDTSIFEFNVKAVTESRELWRLISSKFCFFETRDLLSCGLLVFHLRTVERRIGTSNYVNLLIGHFLLTCFVEYGALQLLNYISADLLPSEVPSGPFYAVYPLLQWSFSEFPSVYQTSRSSEFPLVGPLFLLFIIGLDFAFSSAEAYFVVFCSAIAGALYKDNFLCLRRLLRLPRSLFPRRSMEVITKKIGATVEIQRSMHAEFLEQQVIYSSSIFRNTRTAIVPPENLITQLIEMGFDREHAVQALQSTNNNVEMATNILLNQ